jgi:prophage regulatory protein
VSAPELMTRAEVLALMRVSAPTLKRWVRAGVFPAPLKVGPNTLRWRRSEIDDHLGNRVAAASTTEAPVG